MRKARHLKPPNHKLRELHAAILSARVRFSTSRPNGLRLYEQACKWLPGGNTRSILHHDPFPLSIRASRGPYIWDHDDHRYIDFLNDHTAGLFGHSNPTIIGAVEAALSKGLNGCGNSQMEVDAAALICKRFDSIERVRFTASGTEANLMAITLSRVITERDSIVVFSGAYHGLGLSFRTPSPQANLPFDFIAIEYNNTDALERNFVTDGPRIAAVLIEPMLGSGGCIMADQRFLHAARRLTREHGAILILDEVMTSRLSWGGLQSLFSIKPDLTTLGKYLAGGTPIGALGGRKDLMMRFDPRTPGFVSHNGTFNNNAIGMRAAVAALECYDHVSLEAMNALGERTRRELNAIARSRAAAICFSGFGSMIHAHARRSAPSRYRTPSQRTRGIRELLYLDLLEQGIRISPAGFITLSLVNTAEHCDRLVAAFREFVEARAELV